MRCAWLAISIALVAGNALADADAGPVDAGADADQAPAECVPTDTPAASRALLTDVFPTRGYSGYASTLVVTIDHGKGERVLPAGLDLERAPGAFKVLTEQGWVVPNQDGGAAARITVAPKGDRTTTTFELPLLALPKEPGRQELTLPALPIAMARANGEVYVLCTHGHSIRIEDPTASTDDPKPKANPPPVPQREEWTALKTALELLGAGVVLGVLVAYAIRWYQRRPKRVPPPPPARPAWEVALERLDEVRHAGLLETARFGEYFDRVNDALRTYLGARYGFDGIESTTDEILARMKEAPLSGVQLPVIAEFLQTCDLVKFANMTPTESECKSALDAGESIVRRTIPVPKTVEDPAPEAT